MTRKDFFAKVGFGAAVVLVPSCIAGLASSCSKDSPAATPTNFDFNIDTTTGSLSKDGGFLVSNGIVIARTSSGTFIAVSASCTHQGTNVEYVSGSNNFKCPNHGAEFSNTGGKISGPGSGDLKQYQTALTGTNLRVFS